MMRIEPLDSLADCPIYATVAVANRFFLGKQAQVSDAGAL